MIVRDLAPIDPFEAAGRLADLPGLVFLDSSMRPEALGVHARLGRWSYVAADPHAVLTVRAGRAFLDGEALDEAPLEALRRRLAVEDEGAHDLPPFHGGAVGYLAYDFGRRLERLPDPAVEEPVPEAVFGFYDTLVAFDHLENRVRLISTGRPERDDTGRRRRAGASLLRLANGFEESVDRFVAESDIDAGGDVPIEKSGDFCASHHGAPS